MGVGTPKTDIYKLLVDLRDAIEDEMLGEYGYCNPRYDNLLKRCATALRELEEL